jgi:hypothetical protein
MKLEIPYIKQLTVLLSLIGIPGVSGFSQGTDMGLERRPGAFIGISLGTAQSQIINESDLEIEEISSSDKMTFSGSFDIGYYISKHFGIKTGLGYASYDTRLNLDAYQNRLNLRDSENESYELRVTASALSESQSVNIMNIPLTIVLHIPLSNVVSIFVEPGINFAIPLNYNFSNSGLFTYKGYYPEYNVILENLPNHGFSSNTIIDTEDQLELKGSWLDAIVYCGINIALRPKFHLAAGVLYTKSISNISGYESPDTYQLSPAPGQVTSLMGGSSDVSTSLLGVNITLRYFINR